MNSTNITIADFSINLPSESPISLEEGYLPFINEDNRDADVTIYCSSGIPSTPFENTDKLVFEAKNESQRFYSIFRSGSQLRFIIYNQQLKDTIQQVALLDESYSAWKVYSDPDCDGTLSPLKYPLGPIIMHYLTVKSDAVIIHASCIFDGVKGRIFTGFSGAGKSTMSKLWAAAGNLIINDDRIIIRKRGAAYSAYNTPMYYNDIPKKTSLDAIYLISHSPENRMRKLTGATAVSRVLAFCIQNNYTGYFIQNQLAFLSELCAHIPVYELGFVPDTTIVDYITANER
jgi:hypothetical protein